MAWLLDLFMKYSDAISAMSTVVIAFFSITTFILAIVISQSSKQYQNDIKKLTKELKISLIMVATLSRSGEAAKRLYDEYAEKF